MEIDVLFKSYDYESKPEVLFKKLNIFKNCAKGSLKPNKINEKLKWLPSKSRAIGVDLIACINN